MIGSPLSLFLTKSDIDILMMFLKCKLCKVGEVDIIGNERAINKKTKCSKCGFTSSRESKGPEVIFIRKKHEEA